MKNTVNVTVFVFKLYVSFRPIRPVKFINFLGIIFCGFPHERYFVGFNFMDFAFVPLLQCTAKMFAWYIISGKEFIREIREINPTQNLRLLQHVKTYNMYVYPSDVLKTGAITNYLYFKFHEYHNGIFS